MAVNLAGKRILVLSDDERLARAIELNLRPSAIEIIRLAPGLPWQEVDIPTVGPIDLIVAALSSITTRSAAVQDLAARAAHVPLLVISERHCHAGLDHRATHLDFPFDVNDLCQRVASMLQAS